MQEVTPEEELILRSPSAGCANGGRHLLEAPSFQEGF